MNFYNPYFPTIQLLFYYLVIIKPWFDAPNNDGIQQAFRWYSIYISNSESFIELTTVWNAILCPSEARWSSIMRSLFSNHISISSSEKNNYQSKNNKNHPMISFYHLLFFSLALLTFWIDSPSKHIEIWNMGLYKQKKISLSGCQCGKKQNLVFHYIA